MSDSATLALTSGCLFAGLVIATTVYGVTFLQSCFYYLAYPNDSIFNKSLVGWVWSVDTAHTIVLCWETYGQIVLFNPSPVPAVVEIILSTAVAVSVQLFYTWRIWLLSNRLWLAPLIMVPAILAQPCVAIVYCVKVLQDGTANWAVHYAHLTVVYNSIAAAIDTVITLSLVFVLYRQKSDYHERTNVILARLIFLTVNTGIWTAAFSLLVVIMSAQLPDTLLLTVFFAPLSKLYANMFLGTLNARNYVREGTVGVGPSLLPPPTIPTINALARSKDTQPSGGSTTRVDADSIELADKKPSSLRILSKGSSRGNLRSTA